MDDGSSPLWALTVFTLFIMGNGIMYGFGAAIQKVSESEIEKRALEQKDKKSLWLLDVIQHPGAIVNTISTTAIFSQYFSRICGSKSHYSLCLLLDKTTESGGRYSDSSDHILGRGISSGVSGFSDYSHCAGSPVRKKKSLIMIRIAGSTGQQVL